MWKHKLKREGKIVKRSLSLSRVYGLIEPAPVVMVTTSCNGRPNIMTMSWHTMMEFEPPIIGCVISDRNYTFSILRATKECVINIPTVELAAKMVACGNSSGQTVDEFKMFGLTPAPAACVKAPLIAECYANLECKVIDSRMAKYCFFSCRGSKPGSIPRANSLAPCITLDEATSWSPAR